VKVMTISDTWDPEETYKCCESVICGDEVLVDLLDMKKLKRDYNSIGVVFMSKGTAFTAYIEQSNKPDFKYYDQLGPINVPAPVNSEICGTFLVETSNIRVRIVRTAPGTDPLPFIYCRKLRTCCIVAECK